MKHVHATELENMLADYKTRQSRQRKCLTECMDVDLEQLSRDTGVGIIDNAQQDFIRRLAHSKTDLPESEKRDWLYDICLPIFFIGAFILSVYFGYQISQIW